MCFTAPSLSSYVCSSPSSWRNQGGGGQRTHGVLGSFYKNKHGKRIITCQVESFKALKKNSLSRSKHVSAMFCFGFCTFTSWTFYLHFLTVFLSASQLNTSLLWKLWRGEEIVKKQRKHTGNHKKIPATPPSTSKHCYCSVYFLYCFFYGFCSLHS